MFGVRCRPEQAVVRGRNAGLTHQFLREDLRPLKLGRVATWAEDSKPLFHEGIDDPERQRLFGPYDGQVDPLPLRELNQPARVMDLDRDVLNPVEMRSRVARRAVNLAHAFGLLQLPAEGMLTPPLPDDKDFQQTTSRRSIGQLRPDADECSRLF